MGFIEKHLSFFLNSFLHINLHNSSLKASITLTSLVGINRVGTNRHNRLLVKVVGPYLGIVLERHLYVYHTIYVSQFSDFIRGNGTGLLIYE